MTCDKKDTAPAVKILIEHRLVADQADAIFCRTICNNYFLTFVAWLHQENGSLWTRILKSAHRQSEGLILYNLFAIKL